MNTSSRLQHSHEAILRPLAPIVQLKAVRQPEPVAKKRVSKPKTAPASPGIYDKPIYKPKKYDLL
jgi:hypothetical protein